MFDSPMGELKKTLHNLMVLLLMIILEAIKQNPYLGLKKNN
jgi:hypothetical protein